MSNTYFSGLHRAERLSFGTDFASRLLLRNAPALDYDGETYPAGGRGRDFFDFIPLHSNGLMAVLGEISGEGAAAAVLLPGLRGFLRTGLAGDGGGDIRRVVRDLNRTLCDTAPDSFYATLLCVRIDPERRELHYVNAGHEPAVLVRSGGERVYRLENTGTVLGLTTRAGYGLRTVALEPGDVLAAFTDGVIEACNPAGRNFGASGVLEVLRQHPGARSSELVECLSDAVRRFTERMRPADDRTLVVVRFNDAVANWQLEVAAEEPACAAA